MIQGIYIIFCLLLAYYNKRRISYDLRIYHGLNALLHVIAWGVVFFFTRSWFPLAVLPFEGRIFFDTALNVMRRLPLDYVAKNPKSIIDQGEKKLFGNDGILPKVIYAIIIIVLNIVFYGR